MRDWIRYLPAYLVISLLESAPLAGQQLLPRGSTAEKRAMESFESVVSSGANPKLACRIARYPPRLSFGLRFWSGFDVEIPANAFATGRPGRLITVARVTPDGGQPAFFYGSRRLPEFPPGFKFGRGTFFSTGGGFALGPGDYKVEVLLIDSEDRVCLGNWRVTAKAGKLALRMGPGELASSFVDEWSGVPQRAKPGGKVTVMLHAAPVYRRRNAVRLSSWDLTILLGSLVSLLEKSRFSEARVVAYNLDARRVLFDSSAPGGGADSSRRDSGAARKGGDSGRFDGPAYGRLVESLRSLDLGTVSYGTLTGGGPESLLEDLVARSRTDAAGTEAVIFLGPVSRYAAKLPPRLRELRAELPYAFGILFLPFAAYPEDLVTRFVKAGGGRVVDVFQPEDLVRAIRLLDEKAGDEKPTER